MATGFDLMPKTPMSPSPERANGNLTPDIMLPVEGAIDPPAPISPMLPSQTGRTKPEAQQIRAGHRRSALHLQRAGTPEPVHLQGAAPYSADGLDHTPVDALSSDVESDQVGLATTDTQRRDADLDLLHAALGHYARQLLDIQKVRVAMGNRVAAMERDGLPEHLIVHARATADGLAALEKDLNRYLERSARRHPMASWIKEQRGIGLPGFARLLGITGPLDRFATVSKLWAYLGMHVVDGAAPKRTKGERANWSPGGRVLCYQIGESIVKVGAGGPYRAAYDRKKAYYETDRPEWSQARRHNAALRYAVKELLKAMWVEWHRPAAPREVAAEQPVAEAGAR